MGPSKQKWCISEHKPDWTLQANTDRRGALVSTETNFGPVQTDTERRGALVSTYKVGPFGRHNRRGPLVSTGKQSWAPPDRSGTLKKHTPDWTLQVDTCRHSTLVSTETRFGPIQTD